MARIRVVLTFLAAGLILPQLHVVASDPCAGTEGSLASIEKALTEGRWSDAEAFLLPLDPSHSDCADVVLGLSRLRASQGHFAEAERLFSRALNLAPDDALVHARFARFQYSRGLMRQASYLTSQALTIDPNCVEALVIRGQILEQRGLHGESRAAFDRALSLEPGNIEAHFELGIWFFRINQFQQAARHFEAAVTLGPRRARSLDYLAFSLEMLGEPEAAERNYRAAVELNSEPFFDTTLDFNYGRFLLKQGRYEEALPYIDRAIGLFPKRRGPLYERAKLHLARGDYESARRDAERALALGQPGDMVLDLQIYFLLTKIYTQLGDAEMAGKYAELARTTEIPDHVADLPR